MRAGRKMGLIFAMSIALASGLAVSGLLTTSKTLSSSGSVKAINVEVFGDNECTQAVSSVDWGTPGPGESIEKTVFVKNTGNAPMNLSQSTSAWNPVDTESYLTLSWDLEGMIISADEVLQAVLTLHVSSDISGITDFAFNIIIEGTG